MWSCPLCKIFTSNPSRITIPQRFTAHNNLVVSDILVAEVSKLISQLRTLTSQNHKEWSGEGSHQTKLLTEYPGFQWNHRGLAKTTVSI